MSRIPGMNIDREWAFICLAFVWGILTVGLWIIQEGK